MFRSLCVFSVIALGAVALGSGEDKQCIVRFTTADAGYTSTPISDGGCTWEKGATVLMQCLDGSGAGVAVRYSQADSGVTADDFIIDFSVNPNPYPVYLDANRNVISVLGVSAVGDCGFGRSPRKKPY